MKIRHLIFAFLLLATPVAFSQTPVPSPPAQMPGMSSPQQQMGGMDKMYGSVTKMSEMCQMMMQKEMAAMPYKIAAGVVIGILLLIALVLFIILEMQWIIYWKRLLGASKRDDRA
jgi:hypothetical protein